MAETPQRRPVRGPQSDTLADILERVLETGIVIAGDIRVNLNDVELLTVQIRLLVCSVDKADEMGIDWWKNADYLSEAQGPRVSAADDDRGGDDDSALEAVNQRLARLEERLDELADDADGAAGATEEGEDRS
jgi:hypothetical protein